MGNEMQKFLLTMDETKIRNIEINVILIRPTEGITDGYNQNDIHVDITSQKFIGKTTREQFLNTGNVII